MITTDNILEVLREHLKCKEPSIQQVTDDFGEDVWIWEGDFHNVNAWAYPELDPNVMIKGFELYDDYIIVVSYEEDIVDIEVKELLPTLRDMKLQKVLQ